MAAPITTTTGLKWKDSDFEDLCRGLQILTSSSATRHNLSEDERQQLMENVLQQNVTSFTDWLTTCDKLTDEENNFFSSLFKLTQQSKEDVRKRFAALCISILQHITGLLCQAENSNQDVETQTIEKSGSSDKKNHDVVLLSLEQTKLISLSLQFVVVLAVSPYLSEGVGIPMSYRLGPGQILLASSHDYTHNLSEAQRLRSLLAPLHLLSNALHTRLLWDLVLKNHLSDLICTLIQVRRSAKMILLHCQKCACCEKEEFHSTSQMEGSESKEENIPLSSSAMSTKAQTPDEWLPDISEGSLRKTISFCNTEMDNIFNRNSIPTLLQDMLSLAGLTKQDKKVKTPPWFRRVVVCIIRDIIMQPSGVQQLISPLVSESTMYDNKDWQKCEAVAKIISHCPVTENNIKAFYSSVSQQLMDLIKAKDTPVSKIVSKIVGEAVSQLTNLQADMMEEFCLRPLQSPLLRCCSLQEPGASDVLVDEKELTSTVVCLHRLYVQGQNYQSPFCSTLQPVVGVLFGIFQHVRHFILLTSFNSDVNEYMAVGSERSFQAASMMRLTGCCTICSPLGVEKVLECKDLPGGQIIALTKDLLCCYLNCLDIPKGVSCLLEVLVPFQKETSSYPPLQPEIALLPGEDSGLKIVVTPDKHDDLNSWTQSSETVLELLSSVKSDSLTSELFINLLQRLTNIVTSEITSSDDIILPVHCMSLEAKSAKLRDLKSKTAMLSLISGIGETFGHTVIANTHQVLLFSQITLTRCLEVHKAADDQSSQSFEIDSLTMAMGLLMATLSSTQEFSDKDKKVLDDLLPMLSTLSSSEYMPFHVKEMANNLKVVVATRGHIWPDLRELKSQLGDHKDEKEFRLQGDKTPIAKPLIEVLPDKIVNNPMPANDSKDNHPEKLIEATSGPQTRLQQALDDVQNAMLPVQGHGLICLARMLEEKHPDAIEQKDVLLEIFMTNLSHNDSYIYLATVNGLSALTDLCADDVVPCLSSEFQTLCQKADDLKTVETTLKVGEALVKTTRRLGEMAPKFRDVVLPPILSGCCHDNEMVRASCLSGLAEICRLLRFAINPVLQEVLTCCCDVIKSDACCEPRRAAALTVTSLFQGLGQDSLQTINSSLKDLYHVLKHAVNFDPDDKVKLHTTLALNELEDIMKSILFPEQKLEKNISILGYQ